MTPMVWRFNLDIAPMGAVRMTQRSKWCDVRARAYAAYKQAVRLAANIAEVPQVIPPEFRAVVGMRFRFRRGARCDLDNAAKAILDALWKQDRRVRSLDLDIEEHAGADGMKIVVEFVRR